MKDRFENMQALLTDALNNGNKANYYAYAMGRSRTQSPTLNAVRLTLQLIFNQGIRWISIIQRFGTSNYNLVYEVCKDCLLVFPTLINIAHPEANAQMVEEMEIKIMNSLESNPTDVAWCGLVELIHHKCKWTTGDEIIGLLNRISRAIEYSRFVESMELIQESQLESLQSIYEVTTFKVIVAIIRLYKACCDKFRKKMAYLQVSQTYHKLLDWLRVRYSLLFHNYKEQIAKRQQANSRFKDDIFKFLCELKDFIQVQPLVVASYEQIVSILFAWSVVPSSQSDAEDQHNWEYGLIQHQYGQDLPSHVAKTTTYLASALPGFLRTYINCLMRSNMQANEVFMRLAIVNWQIMDKKYLIQELLEGFFNNILTTLQPFSDDMKSKVQYCRKLRLVLLFANSLKETYFSRLIDQALGMIRRQSYTSFCFKEGVHILRNISQPSHKGRDHLERVAVLTQQKVPYILQSLQITIGQVYQVFNLDIQSQERQGKLNDILTLFQKLLSANQFKIKPQISTIIKRFCEWTIQQAFASWARGKNNTSILGLLVKITKTSIMLMDQEYYMDIESSISGLLQLLKDHRSQNYEQELLQILVFVINFTQNISSSICEILVTLERIVNRAKSIYSIINVIKAICQQKLAKTIVFQWADLCLFFLNLFGNYINNLRTDYLECYYNEYQEIMVVFGRFLQVYEPYFNDHPQIRRNLLQIVRGMKKDEMQLQLLIIMDHYWPIDSFHFFNISDATLLTRRNSFRMLYIYYCKKLMRSFSESSMNQLIKIYQIDQEKRAKRTFKPEIDANWPCLRDSTQSYFIQTLKTLKQNGQIDMMEFAMYRRDLGLQY